MRLEWLALTFAMLLPSAMAYVYFVALSSSNQSGPNGPLIVAYSTAKFVQLGLPIIAWWFFRRPTSSSNITQSRSRWVRIGLIFGMLVGAAIIAVSQVLPATLLLDASAKIKVKIVEFGCDTPARFCALALFLSLGHSLFEEYYWRWFVFGQLRNLCSFLPAITLSSLAFSAHHIFVLGTYFSQQFWTAAVPFTLAIAVGGMTWAWLYDRSNSLLPSWISHIIVDAAIMLVGYKLVFLSP